MCLCSYDYVCILRHSDVAVILWADASKCSKLRHLKRKYVIINLMERGSEFQYFPLLPSVQKKKVFSKIIMMEDMK
jgi:hypothetical protein